MYNTFNGYMQGAQPYGNPYADRLAAMQQSQAMQQRCEVVTVNGENGAQAYPLAPNSSALLLDESQPLVWLVKTDGAGYKTVSAFNITPHEQTQQPTNADLEQRIARQIAHEIFSALRHCDGLKEKGGAFRSALFLNIPAAH